MKMGAGMAVIALVVLTIGSATAEERESSSKHFFLDKNGGGFESCSTGMTRPNCRGPREDSPAITNSLTT